MEWTPERKPVRVTTGQVSEIWWKTQGHKIMCVCVCMSPSDKTSQECRCRVGGEPSSAVCLNGEAKETVVQKDRKGEDRQQHRQRN